MTDIISCKKIACKHHNSENNSCSRSEIELDQWGFCNNHELDCDKVPKFDPEKHKQDQKAKDKINSEKHNIGKWMK